MEFIVCKLGIFLVKVDVVVFVIFSKDIMCEIEKNDIID